MGAEAGDDLAAATVGCGNGLDDLLKVSRRENVRKSIEKLPKGAARTMRPGEELGVDLAAAFFETIGPQALQVECGTVRSGPLRAGHP